MGMKIEKKGDLGILTFDNNVLDNLQIFELKEMLDDMFLDMKEKNNKIIIDLANVEYVDSSGLGFLLIINAKLKKLESKLVFTNVRNKVRDVFDLTQIMDFFKVFNSNDEAINFLNN